MAIEKAMFGAGCFWGVEARFGELTGVIDTAVGYEGGDLEHPTYKEVCTDRTGHAEVVEVTFDNSRLSYDALLDAFFASTIPPRSTARVRTSERNTAASSSPSPPSRPLRPAPASPNSTPPEPTATHRHPGHSGHHLLEGRGIPPALPRKTRHGQLSHLTHRQRPAERLHLTTSYPWKGPASGRTFFINPSSTPKSTLNSCVAKTLHTSGQREGSQARRLPSVVLWFCTLNKRVQASQAKTLAGTSRSGQRLRFASPTASLPPKLGSRAGCSGWKTRHRTSLAVQQQRFDSNDSNAD